MKDQVADPELVLHIIYPSSPVKASESRADAMFSPLQPNGKWVEAHEKRLFKD